MLRAKSGTLTPNVVERVQIDMATQGVTVVNRTQQGEIWVRVDGVDPIVEGNDCFVVLGARTFRNMNRQADVRMIAAEALDFTVEGKVTP